MAWIHSQKLWGGDGAANAWLLAAEIATINIAIQFESNIFQYARMHALAAITVVQRTRP